MIHLPGNNPSGYETRRTGKIRRTCYLNIFRDDLLITTPPLVPSRAGTSSLRSVPEEEGKDRERRRRRTKKERK